MSLSLSQLGEFGLIQQLQKIVNAHPITPFQSPQDRQSAHPPHDPAKALRLGIGDDAAVWRPTPGMELVLTCDTFVEGRHFLPIAPNAETTTLEAIGARVATANLSDLAAMAALPRFALVSLGIPPHLPVDHILAIYRGLTRTLHDAGAHIIGGNITSNETLFLDITAAGEVITGKAIRRAGAQVGDLIGVTGYPGQAAAGLACLLQQPQETLQPLQYPSLASAYLSPTARLTEAQLIAPFIHAMTDISDGLLHDLQHLLDGAQINNTQINNTQINNTQINNTQPDATQPDATQPDATQPDATQPGDTQPGDTRPDDTQPDAARPGAVLVVAQLPLSDALQAYATHIQRPPDELLWTASDDYELLFAAPPHLIPKIYEALAAHKLAPVHWIGTITMDAGIRLQQRDGTTAPLPITGWDHFAR